MLKMFFPGSAPWWSCVWLIGVRNGALTRCS